MHAGLVLSAHAHNIEYYVLVKVVNNASGTRLAGKLYTVIREYFVSKIFHAINFHVK